MTGMAIIEVQHAARGRRLKAKEKKMQVLVLYYSKGGNTRRLAEAVAEGAGQVDGVQVLLRHTDEVSREDFVQSMAVIAGSPVYFGSMAAPLKKVLDDYVGVRRRMENKIGAAFATSGDPTGGKETTLMSILQALLIYGMVIVGDPLSATGHYGVACVGAPDSGTVENAKKMGRRVSELAKLISDNGMVGGIK
jgi:NAD(P)H dehydrogenase (quinone)